MNRWDIINHFIKKNGYKTYLEIGYFKGWSFDNVRCDWKIAVDPNPSKEPWMEQDNWGTFTDFKNEERIQINKTTSDEFFSRLNSDDKVDIVFIDGLHEAQQVMRDIENSLRHLREGGTIVVHDCNPPTYQHVTTGDPGGNWNGDVYKAFINFRMHNLDYEAYVIDTDWGVGVIRKMEPGKTRVKTLPNTHWIAMHTWEDFDRDRALVLNLISVEEFLKREAIYETA